MLFKQKPQPHSPEPEKPLHIKLPDEGKAPNMKTIRHMYDECEARRGTTLEYAWFSDNGNPLYLFVIWEKGGEFPQWTMCEDQNGNVVEHWSQGYPPTDLSLVFDVVAMSAAAGLAPTGAMIPDNLKPPLEPLEEEEAPVYASIDVPPPPAPAPYTPPQSYGQPPAAPAYGNFDAPPGYPPAYEAPPGYPPSYEAPPGYPPNPGAPMQPQYGAAPYPQHQQHQQHPQHPQQPGQPYQPYPQAPMPGYPPQQPAYPGQNPYASHSQMQPVYPPAGWPPQQPGYQTMAPGTIPPGTIPPGTIPPGAIPSNTMHPAPTSSSVETGGGKIPLDLIEKKQNVLLGKMLLEAGFINKTQLDAALKLQDLVRKNQVEPERTVSLLKRYYDKGSDIYTVLDSPEAFREPVTKPVDKPKAPEKSGSSSAPTSSSSTASSSSTSAPSAGSSNKNLPKGCKHDPKEVMSAFEVLKKADFIKGDDIDRALQVRKQIGGDPVDILIAAGKFPECVYDAAVAVMPLLNEGLMKQEQVVVALQYCARSRVDFDTALAEMGWPNPRKIRKDLKF